MLPPSGLQVAPPGVVQQGDSWELWQHLVVQVCDGLCRARFDSVLVAVEVFVLVRFEQVLVVRLTRLRRSVNESYVSRTISFCICICISIR